MSRSRPPKRPFKIWRTVMHGRPVIAINIVCHGRRIGGYAELHGFDLDPSRVAANFRNAQVFKAALRDARKHLRTAQPNRHRIAHLGCYPKDRVDAVMFARMAIERAKFEDLRTGGPLGRALAEFSYHSVHRDDSADEVRRAVGTSDAYTLKVAAELAALRASELGGGV